MTAPLPDAYGFPPEAFDPANLLDGDTNFLSAEDLDAFVTALHAPDPLHSPPNTAPATDDGPLSPAAGMTKRDSVLLESEASRAAAAASAATAGGNMVPPAPDPSAVPTSPPLPSRDMFFSAQSDWAPVNVRVSRRGSSGEGAGVNRRGSAQHDKRGSGKRKRRAGRAAAALLGERNKDETREGYLYALFHWPLLFFSLAWLGSLIVGYVLTRAYIFAFEHYFTWRGRREKLRRNLQQTSSYGDWVAAARELDVYLKRQVWKEENAFAYYDSRTVKTVWEQMRRTRLRLQAEERGEHWMGDKGTGGRAGVNELRMLLEACVKNNFVGIENARLYSQTYYGTKNLVQNFVDELEKSLQFILETDRLGPDEKRDMFRRVNANYGRTALCLSGGASFAYYHFGVVRALLDADLLPTLITGTSGGALVAALVATRTDDELRRLLVPALAARIDVCSEPVATWFARWWRTGARFDSVDWARRCSWWTRGSMTFREAYRRTGRILNVSCVPADPHSPTILCNHLTSPDCVIWSAVLASAAVPGILNPVVLMMKQRDGTLAPYSFGHKWKDGSLRTDIPIKALNLHFNVNFTVVSQVNPHVNLFFFSARGRVGNPVTHRKGRGWRGGFLMSALEHWIRLDMHKWLHFVRAAEILPRPLGQDWSQLWLQQFNGTVTLWPKTAPSDFWHVLSDPDPPRLARMIHEGRQSAFPVLKFVSNRLRVERLVERGWRETRARARRGSVDTMPSEEDGEERLRGLLMGEGGPAAEAALSDGGGADSFGERAYSGSATEEEVEEDGDSETEAEGLSLKRRLLTREGEGNGCEWRMRLVDSDGEDVGYTEQNGDGGPAGGESPGGVERDGESDTDSGLGQ